VEEGGVEGLFDQSRRKPNVKNRTDEATEAAVVAYALEVTCKKGSVTNDNHLHSLGGAVRFNVAVAGSD